MLARQARLLNTAVRIPATGLLSVNIHNNAADSLEALKLPESASKQDIRNSYLKLSKEFHPDVNKEVNAKIKYQAIREAYDYLTSISYDGTFSSDVGSGHPNISQSKEQMSENSFQWRRSAQRTKEFDDWLKNVQRDGRKFKVRMKKVKENDTLKAEQEDWEHEVEKRRQQYAYWGSHDVNKEEDWQEEKKKRKDGYDSEFREHSDKDSGIAEAARAHNRIFDVRSVDDVSYKNYEKKFNQVYDFFFCVKSDSKLAIRRSEAPNSSLAWLLVLHFLPRLLLLLATLLAGAAALQLWSELPAGEPPPHLSQQYREAQQRKTGTLADL